MASRLVGQTGSSAPDGVVRGLLIQSGAGQSSRRAWSAPVSMTEAEEYRISQTVGPCANWMRPSGVKGSRAMRACMRRRIEVWRTAVRLSVRVG